MSKTTDALTALGALSLVPLMFFGMAASTILNGWVLSILWAWFIVPVFGLPQITIGQSIGLAMIVNYLTYQYIDNSSDKDGSRKTAKVIIYAVTRPLVSLIFGYIVHFFI